MVRLKSIYPDGLTGVALLLMRLAYAWLPFPVLSWLQLPPPQWWLAVVASGLLAVALASGLGTRGAALLVAAGSASASAILPAGAAALLLPHASGALALMILGPGAFSVDAHLFGRRVIRLDPRRIEGGSSD